MYKIGVVLISLAILLGGLYFFFGFRNDSHHHSTLLDLSKKIEEAHFSTWKEFIPQSKLFKVSLPTSPRYAKDFMDIPDSDKKRRYDMYASEKIDGTIFLISVMTYPHEIDVDSHDTMLKQTVDELMRSHSANRLMKLQNQIFKNYRTLDFSMDNHEFHIEGKVIINDKTIYVLNYIANIENFDADEYHHFVNSFELLEKK